MAVKQVVVLCFSKGIMLWAVTIVGVLCVGVGVRAQNLPATATVVVQGNNPKA